MNLVKTKAISIPASYVLEKASLARAVSAEKLGLLARSDTLCTIARLHNILALTLALATAALVVYFLASGLALGPLYALLTLNAGAIIVAGCMVLAELYRMIAEKLSVKS